MDCDCTHTSYQMQVANHLQELHIHTIINRHLQSQVQGQYILENIPHTRQIHDLTAGFTFLIQLSAFTNNTITAVQKPVTKASNKSQYTKASKQKPVNKSQQQKP